LYAFHAGAFFKDRGGSWEIDNEMIAGFPMDVHTHGDFTVVAIGDEYITSTAWQNFAAVENRKVSAEARRSAAVALEQDSPLFTPRCHRLKEDLISAGVKAGRRDQADGEHAARGESGRFRHVHIVAAGSDRIAYL